MSNLEDGKIRIGRMNLDYDFNATIKKHRGLPATDVVEHYTSLLEKEIVIKN